MASGTIGERIAAYRRRRGLSQAALAGLIGRSESWLSQVERGVRAVDRLSVLVDMARVLRIDAQALIGVPWQFAPNGWPVLEGLAAVRHFLSRYDNLIGSPPCGRVDVARVRERTAVAHRAYQAARYESVVADLPALLAAADAFHQRTDADERRSALLEYVAAYALAAKLLTKMGAGDLARLVADRCATAAVEADSTEARGIAAYQVACALLRTEQPGDAECVAVTMAELVHRGAGRDKPVLVSVAGSLWLLSAIVAARRGDRGEAWRRLDIAGRLAGILGQDLNFAWTAFGTTNVAIHRVSVAAELGDPAAAVRASDAVDTDRLPAELNSRRAQVHLDLAWAQAHRRRDAEAVLHLLEAERVAPEAMRYNVLVGEIVREMLARQKRSKTSALHDLAVRAGVLE